MPQAAIEESRPEPLCPVATLKSPPGYTQIAGICQEIGIGEAIDDIFTYSGGD